MQRFKCLDDNCHKGRSLTSNSRQGSKSSHQVDTKKIQTTINSHFWFVLWFPVDNKQLYEVKGNVLICWGKQTMTVATPVYQPGNGVGSNKCKQGFEHGSSFFSEFSHLNEWVIPGNYFQWDVCFTFLKRLRILKFIKKCLDYHYTSLQKHPFLLALRQWGCFARRNICDSATKIPYWWRKICPESSQKSWLVDGVVTLFKLLLTNDRQKTKGHKGQMKTRRISILSSLEEAFEFCWSLLADEHNTLLKSTRRHVKLNKFVFGTPWLLDFLCKHRFASSVWNFCRWVADVPPRETSPAAKSEEKRMFSQATITLASMKETDQH